MDKGNRTKIGTDKIITILLVVIAFVLGFVGLYKLEGDFWDALYGAIRLYGLNCDYTGAELNIYLHIARYLAPLALLSFLITALSNFIENIIKAVKVLWLGYYAVSGSGQNYDAIVAQFTAQGVKFVQYSGAVPKKADKQVYIADIEQDLARIVPAEWDDADSNICYYLVANTLLEYSKHPANVTLCSLASVTARSYWRDNPIASKEEKIAIIGTGRYAELLLLTAICNNVVAVDSNIKYYVFGNMNNFIATHYKMDRAIGVQRVPRGTQIQPMQGDAVYFVESPWEENSQLIAEVDRVIICKERDSQCVDVYNSLSELYLASSISIKLIEHGILAKSLRNQNAVIFGQRDSLCTKQNIIDVAYNVTSKMIHANYLLSSQKAKLDAMCADDATVVSGSRGQSRGRRGSAVADNVTARAEQECKHYLDYVRRGCTVAEWVQKSQLFTADWVAMSNFHRRSNEMAADHIPIKIALVMGQDYDGIFDVVAYDARLAELKNNPAIYTQLCEIDHIRWCRYHYMNNWEYAPVRNNAKRQHHLLVPLSQLSDIEIAKDWENYEVISALYC